MGLDSIVEGEFLLLRVPPIGLEDPPSVPALRVQVPHELIRHALFNQVLGKTVLPNHVLVVVITIILPSPLP